MVLHGHCWLLHLPESKNWYLSKSPPLGNVIFVLLPRLPISKARLSSICIGDSNASSISYCWASIADGLAKAALVEVVYTTVYESDDTVSSTELKKASATHQQDSENTDANQPCCCSLSSLEGPEESAGNCNVMTTGPLFSGMANDPTFEGTLLASCYQLKSSMSSY